MATAVAIAIRKSEAQARLQAASVKLAKTFGVDAVDLAPHSKYPDVQAAMTLEAIASFLEALAAKKPDERAVPAAPPKTTPRKA